MSSPGHPPRLQLALPSSTTSFKRSFEQFGFELDDSSPGSATNQVEHGGAVGTASAVGPSSSGLGHSRSGIMDGTTSFGGTGSGFGFNNGSNSYGRGATLGRQDRNKRARSDTSERSPSSFSASLSSVRDGRVSALSATASLSTSVSESDEGEESFTTAHTSLNLSPIEGVSPIRISGLFEPSARLVNVQAEDVNEHREDRAQDVDMHDVLESPPSPTLPQAQVQRLPATPSPPPAPTTLPTRSLLSALPFHEPPTSPAPSQSLESSRASSSARPIPPRINTFERWATDRFRSAATPSPTTAVSINTETRGLPEQDFFGPGSLGRMTPPWLRRALPSVDTSGPNLLDVIDQASSVASDSSSVDMERVSSDPGSQQSSHSHSFLTDVISHNFQRGDTSSASSPSRRPLPRTPLELPAPSSSTAPMPSPSLLTPSTLAARRYIESPLLPLPPAPGMGASVTWAYDDSLGEWWHRAAGTPDAGESSSQEARGPMPRIRRQEFLQLAPSPSPTRLRFGLMSPADRTGRSGTGAVSGSENGGPLDSPRELREYRSSFL
ncbi:hypothetical protein SISSUDRAFT_225179 [Sistotremastrum suecicum HHB10207 ss-3]|uniref:Uncharacterized protein n=1 Tax=Sistotremastrum suecicum HHB10207 ss-3 TaxID=1314776 RepID=A0A166A3M5_9AGAM|nr:hypothetical protein SISSUDRAFT_225179 [Sistotremastrum suecicum HHB10207 ss-3]